MRILSEGARPGELEELAVETLGRFRLAGEVLELFFGFLLLLLEEPFLGELVPFLFLSLAFSLFFCAAFRRAFTFFEILFRRSSNPTASPTNEMFTVRCRTENGISPLINGSSKSENSIQRPANKQKRKFRSRKTVF
ncbi:MAG: hypothetical protein HRT57_07555 [Crocinitomicaceae bacterium]|nr:hypothetical protein [Crocinitomicaceae bacterium]